MLLLRQRLTTKLKYEIYLMESSDNAESPAIPRRDTKDSDTENSDNEVLFKYPSRGGENFSVGPVSS